MDKFIGTILMIAVLVICFYLFINLDKLNNIVIPVPDKVVDYFKVEPFDSGFTNPTTTPQQ